MDKQLIISKALGVFLVEVENGEVHFTGYYGPNENDEGPHPLRYVEVSGYTCPVRWLHKFAIGDINLDELVSDFEQYIYDEEEDTDEWTMNNYCKDIANRKVIKESDLKDGPLPDGVYAVVEWYDEEKLK